MCKAVVNKGTENQAPLFKSSYASGQTGLNTLKLAVPQPTGTAANTEKMQVLLHAAGNFMNKWRMEREKTHNRQAKVHGEELAQCFYF